MWDYENIRVVVKGIEVPLAESLDAYTAKIGFLRIKKINSDWTNVNKTILKAMYSLGFEPIQVSMGKTNSVDVKIAVDCLDTAQLIPSISTYIIVTGDKDFIPVINWLKSHKKRVIIIGKADLVSDHLLLSANDFISLEELSKLEKQQKSSKENGKQKLTISFTEAVKCLVQSIHQLHSKGKPSRFLTLDKYMRSLDQFNYRGAASIEKPNGKGNFTSFTNLVKMAESQGKVKSITVNGFREIRVNPSKKEKKKA
ncbi:NYN domain-containing protein [Candidatus Lokiarchaeum ossiferum]